ncbi:MAG: hypothetical protein QF577_09425 [Phycisphaerae bacterium]|jgi:hypothetical protein|nr:hypothetical protein [Phycisphaerae bacterium]
MNRQALRALVVINLVLLVMLLLVMVVPQSASAQLRGRDIYTMVAGQTQERTSQDLIYVANLTSGDVVSLIYESENDKLVIIGRLNFSRELEASVRRRP